MAVSLRDRQRVSDLVRSEFQAKRDEATREPSDLEVEKVQDNLMKSLRLSKMIAELDAAEKKAGELKKKLAEAVRAAKPATLVMEGRASRRWDNCECTGDYRELLKDIAKHLATLDVRNGANRFTIAKEERRLLAKIEVAGSTEDLNKVLKAAGLVG